MPVWLNQNIALIDTNGYGFEEAIAAYVVRGSRGAALVDAGYSSTWERVIASVRELGIGLDEIQYIFLTHFHLDHAGASWHLLKHLKNARVVIHEGAIRHLIDPSRLVEAAHAAFGEDLAEHIGELRPIQPERIEPAREQEYELGGVSVEVLFTPGHVPSHISIHVPQHKALITGDAVVVRRGKTPFKVPAASPPMYDVDAAVKSVERLASYNPAMLLTPHYGERRVSAGEFEEQRRIIEEWADRVSSLMQQGMDYKQISEAMRDSLLREAGVKLSDLDDFTRVILLGKLLPLTVQGYMGYLLRRR